MNLSKTKAKRLLKEIYDMACEASMTESLRDGSEVLIANYNKIREIAINNGWVGSDWVVELNKGESELLREDVEWVDVIGTAAKLFIAQLDEEDEEDEE